MLVTAGYQVNVSVSRSVRERSRPAFRIVPLSGAFAHGVAEDDSLLPGPGGWKVGRQFNPFGMLR